MYKRGLINKIFNIQYNNTLRLKDLIKEKSIRNKENIVKEVYSVNNKCGFILQAEQFKDREVASEDTSNYKIVQYNDFAYNPARINVGSIARMKKYHLDDARSMIHKMEEELDLHLILFVKDL